MPSRGHYKPASERKEALLSVKVTRDTAERLDAIARALGRKRGDVAREALDVYLDAMEGMLRRIG